MLRKAAYFASIGLAAALFSLAVSRPASASPVTWTFQNANFNDGGTASGFFVWDADTLSLSNWNISVTTGSTLSAFDYTPSDSFLGGCFNGGICILSFQSFPDPSAPNPERRVLELFFATALTDTGGTVNLLTTSVDCLNCDPFRSFTSGDVTTLSQAATPEPSSLLLLGSGLLGLGPFVRRRVL